MRTLLKNSTDARIVKNFLVVVKIEHVSGPKFVIVMKMKFCDMCDVCVCVCVSMNVFTQINAVP